MKEKKYQQEQARQSRYQDIYRLRMLERVGIKEIEEKLGIPRSSIYRALSTFERENPKEAEQMKKQGKDVTPKDYKKLQKEIALLKKELAHERLRGDFYQEMVDFGKEVYGIDLKKVGTK